MSPSRPLLLLTLVLLAVAPAGAQSKPTKPSAASAVVTKYDGHWSGTTSQGLAIVFTVAQGKVTDFSVGGQFAGAGCSTTSTTQTTLSAPVRASGFRSSVHSGPGGVSFTVSGTFSGAGTAAKAAGTIEMSFQSAPGPPPGIPGVPYTPPCHASASAAWAAQRGAAPAAAPASSKSSAAAPAADAQPAVNRAYDGRWQGKTDQGKDVSFVVSEGTMIALEVTGDFSKHRCGDISANTKTNIRVGPSFSGAFFLGEGQEMQLIDLRGSIEGEGAAAKASGTMKLGPKKMECMWVDVNFTAERQAAQP